MKNKMLLITCIALFFTGCASVNTADTDKPSLTPDNSVLIYGYIDDISEITFIKQSPDFKYELIEGITHSDCFVLPPVPADSELKLYKYETFRTNFFAATSSSGYPSFFRTLDANSVLASFMVFPSGVSF